MLTLCSTAKDTIDRCLSLARSGTCGMLSLREGVMGVRDRRVTGRVTDKDKDDDSDVMTDWFG